MLKDTVLLIPKLTQKSVDTIAMDIAKELVAEKFTNAQLASVTAEIMDFAETRLKNLGGSPEKEPLYYIAMCIEMALDLGITAGRNPEKLQDAEKRETLLDALWK